MELPAAALEGLKRVYKTIQEDGVIDIGLQAALDVGLPANGYIHVPERVLKTVRLGGEEGTTIQKAKNTPSGKRLAAPDIIRVVREEGKYTYTYRGIAHDVMRQAKLDAEDIASLVVTDYCACIEAGWDEAESELIVSAHVMAILVGAVDAGGEVVIVRDPDLKSPERVPTDLLTWATGLRSRGTQPLCHQPHDRAGQAPRVCPESRDGAGTQTPKGQDGC